MFRASKNLVFIGEKVQKFEKNCLHQTCSLRIKNCVKAGFTGDKFYQNDTFV